MVTAAEILSAAVKGIVGTIAKELVLLSKSGVIDRHQSVEDIQNNLETHLIEAAK